MNAKLPPAPDTSHQPSYGSYEDVVEIMYGARKHRRAIITKDITGIFRVRFQEWDITGWDQGELIEWISASRASLTDTLQQARKIARGQVGNLTGQDH
jgi:hypothetical protein